MKKITLTIGERIAVMNLLPSKGSYEKLIIRKEVISKCEISAVESRTIGLKTVENSLTWDATKAKGKCIEFHQTEIDHIASVLKEVSGKGEMHSHDISVYEKFCK